MNKVITHLGGHTVKNTDINVVQNSLFMLVKAIADSLIESTGYSNMVVSGCNAFVATGLLIVPEGFVMIDSELFAVDSQTMPYTSANFYYYELQIVDTNARVYKDLVTRDATQIRKAIVVEYTTVNPSAFNVLSNKKYADLIQKKCLDQIEGDWQIFPAAIAIMGGSYTAAPVSGLNQIYHKVIGKTCHVTAKISFDTTGAGSWTEFVIDLPTSIIPKYDNNGGAIFWIDSALSPNRVGSTYFIAGTNKLYVNTHNFNAATNITASINITFPIQ